MSRNSLYRRGIFTSLLVALTWSVADAREFRSRRVTNLGSATSGSSATPLAVLDDRILFLAIANNRPGLYQTDGNTVGLIDDTVSIPSNVGLSTPFDVETVIFRGEVYFSGEGPNGRELYATNGQALRPISDVAPGPLSSFPSEMRVINDWLWFSAISEDLTSPPIPVKLFRTDGMTVHELPVVITPSIEPQWLGDQLLFAGHPPGGGAANRLYATDGQTLSLLDLPPTAGGSLSAISTMTRVGTSVFAIGHGPTGRGVFESDGLSVTLRADFNVLTPGGSNLQSAFALDGNFYFTIEEFGTRDTALFCVNDATVVEVLSTPFSERLTYLYSDGDRAFFTSHDSDGVRLIEFNGTAMNPLLNLSTNPQSILVFGKPIEIDDRFFIHAVEEGNVGLYEVIETGFMRIGPAVGQLTAFAGEVLGVEPNPSPFPNSADELVLVESGGYQTLGEIIDKSRNGGNGFIKYRGALYFRGADGRNSQLYAIHVVPEPRTALMLLMMAGLLALNRCLGIQRHSPCALEDVAGRAPLVRRIPIFLHARNVVGPCSSTCESL